ncbi:MAG: TauD/TfdA family dioxygenase [Alphaproteobacteria bacterium]|nr:TauD/TfdA family dioxygenase [Alphaproteobacteria bacterium]
MSLHIQPIAGVGAEIQGVDLRRELSNAEFATIRDAFAQHGVIFFRDQAIDEQQHIAFARRWAPININRFFSAHPRFPEIALVSKERGQQNNIGGGWHTDHSYDQIPAMGSILVARELPPEGGNTLFASMYAAHDALSQGMREMLSRLKAVHSARHIFGEGPDTYYKQTDAGNDRIGNAKAAEALQDVVHPVIITHPLSGKQALYVNPAFTIRFEGWTAEESKPLLNQLYAHCMRPDFVHEFVWRDGSIAFWDNRSTWHFARNDYHGHRREMHRITVEGEPLTGTA